MSEKSRTAETPDKDPREYRYTLEDIEEANREKKEQSKKETAMRIFGTVFTLAVFLIPLAVWQFIGFEFSVLIVLSLLWISLLTN